MSNTFLVIIKFVVAVLLLPIVWATAVMFHQHVSALPEGYGDFFFRGMFGFVVIFLFLYKFWGVHEFGQRIISGLFRFTSPLNHFIAKIIPFYVTLVLLAFYGVKHFLNIDQYDHYFMFFAGFTFTMHVLLMAQDLQENEKVFINPTYLFVLVSASILMVFYVVLLFNLVLKEFTFLELVKMMWKDASEIYYFVLQKIPRFGVVGNWGNWGQTELSRV